MQKDFFGIIVMFEVIMVNGLALYIRHIVGKNGYKTSWFSRNFDDIANLHRLINREKSVYRKRNYQILLFGFYLSLFLVVISFFVMAASSH